MNDDALLTVAICTHDRADLIENALASLEEQTDRSDAWRVLVVANACGDDTEARVERAMSRSARVALAREPRPGLSLARNTAFETCGTPWILYVDDDSRFPPDYVERALRIVRERRPRVFGGPILPWYQTPPPPWFLDDYGSYSLPHRAGRSDRIFLSGANIGFSTAALFAVGGFHPRLGLHGKRRGYGEETEVEQRILRRYGPASIWYDPAFVNFHLVRPERYRWHALTAEHFSRGLARARVARLRVCEDVSAPAPSIPDCLRPSSIPAQGRKAMRWQNVAYEYGLPLLRLLGYLVGRAETVWQGHRSRGIAA